jgi:hypothetical protein
VGRRGIGAAAQAASKFRFAISSFAGGLDSVEWLTASLALVDSVWERADGSLALATPRALISNTIRDTRRPNTITRLRRDPKHCQDGARDARELNGGMGVERERDLVWRESEGKSECEGPNKLSLSNWRAEFPSVGRGKEHDR